mgnify:CR=1 FL=1
MTTWSVSTAGEALIDMVRQSDGQYESLYAKISAAVTIDTTKPVLTQTVDSFNSTTGVYTFKFASTEALVGFDVSDVTVSTGATKTSALTAVGTDSKIFNLDVTPVANSAPSATAADVTVSVATAHAGSR